MLIRKLKIPEIEIHERTPLVDQLIEIINKQQEQIDVLCEEVKRLKKHKGKPKLRANSLNNSKQGKQAECKKQPRKQKKQADEIQVIKAEGIPEGSRFKGYRYYEVQELDIQTKKILYKLERWQLADGSYVLAKLPVKTAGSHFGPILRSHILHQYHHQGVTEPLLLKQLREWGIEISSGALNNLLITDKEEFHKEKKALLPAAFSVSSHINVDDTGARHKGKNGYCTHIGNELFAWFKSTTSKSRINFLELLRQDNDEYFFSRDSYSYLKKYKGPKWIQDKLKPYIGRRFNTKQVLEEYLKMLGITKKGHVRLVTEAGLIGSILRNGFSKGTVIVSDDAGQFNIFQHALCWIHAERGIASLIPAGRKQRKAVKWARDEIWNIYHLLINYKKNPYKEFQQEIRKRFNSFCKTKTLYKELNLALKRLYANRHELLLVLKRPEIPLHNNLSERDIREYVKRRKISGSTRSDDGRECRDTFASLKKTAVKLRIAFWDYLVDRLTGGQNIPWLPDLITQAATSDTS